MGSSVVENPFIRQSEDQKISYCGSHWNTEFIDSSFDDWLAYLKYHNDRPRSSVLEMSPLLPPLECLVPPRAAVMISKWCLQIGLPASVQHRTLEIYEDFFVAQCYHLLEESPIRPAGISHLVHQQTVWAEMKHQSLLSMISCLQIASKLESNYTAVTVNMAAQLLKEADKLYDPSSIVQSEVRVLVILKHDVNIPPITDYIDMFACKLASIRQKSSHSSRSKRILSSIDEIHQFSQQILNVIFFHHQEILEEIASKLYGPVDTPGVRAQERIHRLKRNKLLLAAGIIVAATYLVEANASADIMKDLHAYVGAHPSDVAVVSSVLIVYLEKDVTG